MSYWKEMAATAQEAGSRWEQRNQLAVRGFHKFYQGFFEYCEMPAGGMKLMPWDDHAGVFKWEEGPHGIEQSMHRDEVTDEWSIGLFIALNEPTKNARLHINFGLFLKEQDGKLIFRMGSSPETRTVAPDSEADWNALYLAMVEGIKLSLITGKEGVPNKMGFPL